MNTCRKCGAERYGKDTYCGDCRRVIRLRALDAKPICSKCGIRPHASNTVWCKECRNAYAKERVRKNPGINSRRYDTPEGQRKRHARVIIYHLIALGLLTREPCAHCGAAADKSEAHHHKGYEGWNAIEIEWLCKSCHTKADMKMNLTIGRPTLKSKAIGLLERQQAATA
jgi:hypothetical protein